MNFSRQYSAHTFGSAFFKALDGLCFSALLEPAEKAVD